MTGELSKEQRGWLLKGARQKAARVLDQAFTPSNLPDEETLDKLSELHPQKECDFRIPADAPIMSGIEMEELRAAGKRLAKGANRVQQG